MLEEDENELFKMYVSFILRWKGKKGIGGRREGGGVGGERGEARRGVV